MEKKLLILTLCLAFLMSCSNDDENTKELKLSDNTLYAKIPSGTLEYPIRVIGVEEGNGGYTITPENNSQTIAEATLVEGEFQYDALIEFMPKQLGTATYWLSDATGQKQKIEMIVDNPYFLLEIYHLDFKVYADSVGVAQGIEERLRRENMLVNGYIYELRQDGGGKKMVTYTDMLSAVFGKEQFEGSFSLDSDSPHITVETSRGEQTYKIYGSFIQYFYDYFDVPMNFELRNEIGSMNNVVRFAVELECDMTDKYKELYPDKGIRYVSFFCRARGYQYRYFPLI